MQNITYNEAVQLAVCIGNHYY